MSATGDVHIDLGGSRSRTTFDAVTRTWAPSFQNNAVLDRINAIINQSIKNQSINHQSIINQSSSINHQSIIDQSINHQSIINQSSINQSMDPRPGPAPGPKGPRRRGPGPVWGPGPLAQGPVTHIPYVPYIYIYFFQRQLK